jgi:hypothetical protein
MQPVLDAREAATTVGHDSFVHLEQHVPYPYFEKRRVLVANI